MSLINLQRLFSFRSSNLGPKYLTFALGLGQKQRRGRLVDGTSDQSHASYVRLVLGGVSTTRDQKLNPSCIYMSVLDGREQLRLGRQICGDELQPVKIINGKYFMDLLTSQKKVTGKLRKFMPFEFFERITEAVPALREDRQLSAAS